MSSGYHTCCYISFESTHCDAKLSRLIVLTTTIHYLIKSDCCNIFNWIRLTDKHKASSWKLLSDSNWMVPSDSSLCSNVLNGNRSFIRSHVSLAVTLNSFVLRSKLAQPGMCYATTDKLCHCRQISFWLADYTKRKALQLFEIMFEIFVFLLNVCLILFPFVSAVQLQIRLKTSKNVSVDFTCEDFGCFRSNDKAR